MNANKFSIFRYVNDQKHDLLQRIEANYVFKSSKYLLSQLRNLELILNNLVHIVCMYVCVRACVRACVHACAYVGVRAYVRTYVRTYSLFAYLCHFWHYTIDTTK